MPLAPDFVDAATIGQLLEEAAADVCATAELLDTIPDVAWFKAKAAGRAEGLALALGVLVGRPADDLIDEARERHLTRCPLKPLGASNADHGGTRAGRAVPDGDARGDASA